MDYDEAVGYDEADVPPESFGDWGEKYETYDSEGD